MDCADCKWCVVNMESDSAGHRWRWECWIASGTPADRAVYYRESSKPLACCEHTPREKTECGF